MMTTFQKKLKRELDGFSPSPELLDRISLMLREEAERPRVSPLRTGARFAGMAAAVALLAFGAVRLGLFTPLESADPAGPSETAAPAPESPSAAIDASAEPGIALYHDENAPAAYSGEQAARTRARGGDELSSYYALSAPSIAAIDGGIIQIVGDEAFEEWRLAKEAIVTPTDLAENMNLYALILDFPAEKEAIRARLFEISAIELLNGWSQSLTEEEIALLCDGEKDAVSEHFVSPAAVYHSGKIYSPEWLDTHTVADYEAEGIPKDRLRERLDEILWLSRCIDLTSLAEKLSEYLGETVTLPTEFPIEAGEVPTIDYEAIPEEVSEDVPEEEVPEDVPEETENAEAPFITS